VTRRLAPLLLLPALALAACGGSGGDEPSTAGAVTAQGEPSAQTAAVVGNAKLTFVPETVAARVGTLALSMTIEGGVPHDLEFKDKAVGAPIPVVTMGTGTSSYTFSKAGTYDFVCTLHSGMVGQVVVG
jgi:plastocyanin